MKGGGPAWEAWRRKQWATRCAWLGCTREGKDARIFQPGLDPLWWRGYRWERRCQEHAPEEGAP